MTVLEAIISGVIFGFTYIFPVSDSGHFSIIGNFFKYSTTYNGNMLYDALLRLCIIAAIIVVYWQECNIILSDIIYAVNSRRLSGRDEEPNIGLRLGLMMLFSCVPLLFMIPVRQYSDLLYSNSGYIGAALILNGLIVYIFDMLLPGKKSEKSITVLDVILIGLCQCVGVFPGFSRIGILFTACAALGFKRSFSSRFVFLSTIFTLLGENIYSLVRAIIEGINWSAFPAYLLGMVCCILSSVAALSLMKKFILKKPFRGFAFYCWILGVLTVILTLIF